MPDRVYYGYYRAVRDMADLFCMLEVGGPGGNLGKVGVMGFESGIMDPFLSQAPWGVGFPQVASTGDTCLLGLGDQTTWVA
jgi:hypothetical protein